jgi:hypothetical protein
MIFYATVLLLIILVIESLIFFYFIGYLPLIYLVVGPIGFIISIILYGKFGDRNKGILKIFEKLKIYYKNRHFIPIAILIISIVIIFVEPVIYYSINKEIPKFLVEIVKSEKAVPDVEIVLQELREWPVKGIRLSKKTDKNGRAFFYINSPGFWQIALVQRGTDSIATCLLPSFVIERFPYKISFDLNNIPSKSWKFERKSIIHKPDIDFRTADIYSYPNPFRAKEGHSKITFTNLPPNSNLVVATTGGNIVRSEDNIGPGDWIWDVKNNSGIDIASGVYLYAVGTRGASYRGKILIIR